MHGSCWDSWTQSCSSTTQEFLLRTLLDGDWLPEMRPRGVPGASYPGIAPSSHRPSVPPPTPPSYQGSLCRWLTPVPPQMAAEVAECAVGTRLPCGAYSDGSGALLALGNASPRRSRRVLSSHRPICPPPPSGQISLYGWLNRSPIAYRFRSLQSAL